MSGGDWKQMFKGVQENDYELVSYYLLQGIDPNYQHPEYMALPLSESVRYGHIDIAELLLDHGANPFLREMESGESPMFMAQNTEKRTFVDLMSNYMY